MKFERSLKPQTQVNLVPMIDVVFQLVVFFMVSSTFITAPGIALDLPSSSSSEPSTVTRTIVTVGPDGQLYLDDEQLSIDGLARELALRRQEIPEAEREEQLRSAVLDADATVPYQTIVQVLDVMRQNGYMAVNLRTSGADGGAGGAADAQ